MTHTGMVHALRELHRVLKPGGLLIDLRPAKEHRRVGIRRGRKWRELGVLTETFEDDEAADFAVGQVVAEGLFRRIKQSKFDCAREMDSLEDFRDWLEEFPSSKLDWKNLGEDLRTQLNNEFQPGDKIVVKEPLMLRLLHNEFQPGDKIVVKGPLMLRLLRKEQHR